MLKPGYSPETISENIATEKRAGKPTAQAIAIGLHEAAQYKPKGKKKKKRRPVPA